jgi:putative ABC transport system permease protein
MLAFSDMRARLLRYFLTALAIGVGVALLVSLTAVSDAAREYVERTLTQLYPADIMVYSESVNIPAYLVHELREHPLVEAAHGVVITTGLHGGSVVSVVGVPLSGMSYFAVELEEGRLPSAGGEAVVEESVGARPGDTITVKLYVAGGERAVKLRVVGVMRSFLRGFIGAFRLNLVVIPLEWLQESLDVGPFVNAVLITVRDKSKVGLLHEALRRTYREAQVYTQKSLLETVARLFNALNAVFAVISGAALAAATVTTFAVLSITVSERIREFGLLKAMGVLSRDIVASVLVEVLVVAGIASALGIAAGYFGVDAVREILRQTGISFELAIKLAPRHVALALLSSLTVALAGALVPLVRVARLRPLEVMRAWQ